MRVLVAGASGALGIPLIRTLRGHGHEVLGTTRSLLRTAAIEDLGARAVVADAMDSVGIGAAVRQAEPEVVIDLLTALPQAGPMRPADMRLTNETRVKASGNLLDAAIQAGVRRYVAESFYLVYGSGDLGQEPLAEDRSIPISVAHPKLTEVISAMVTKEGRALDATKSGQIEGLVLRFGGFYGMGAGLENIVAMLRKRRLPVVNSKNATPWVHIDDAAAAVVLAMEKGHPGGIYNVVDDQPLPMAVFFRTVAQLAGAPQPITVPGFVVQVFAPYLKALLVDSNIRPPTERRERSSAGHRNSQTPRRGSGRFSPPKGAPILDLREADLYEPAYNRQHELVTDRDGKRYVNPRTNRPVGWPHRSCRTTRSFGQRTIERRTRAHEIGLCGSSRPGRRTRTRIVGRSTTYAHVNSFTSTQLPAIEQPLAGTRPPLAGTGPRPHSWSTSRRLP